MLINSPEGVFPFICLSTLHAPPPLPSANTTGQNHNKAEQVRVHFVESGVDEGDKLGNIYFSPTTLVKEILLEKG